MAISKKISGKQKVYDELAFKDKVTRLKTASEESQTSLFAKKINLPYLDLNIYPIGIETLHTVPEKFARAGNLVIIGKAGKNLKVAISDPEREGTKQAIKHLQEDGFVCQLFLVSKTGLSRAFERYQLFDLGKSLEKMRINLSGEDLKQFEKEVKELIDLKKKIQNLPTTEILKIIIAGAVKLKASDVHFEPQKEHVRLRYRLDGVLQNVTQVPYKTYPYVLSRIKMLAKLKLNIKDKSQDGRFDIKLTDPDRELGVRVSILPGNFGENIVMRLLDQNMGAQKLEKLGLRGRAFEQLLRQIAKPNGMILNTGPTGSGKTTTLYSCLNRVNSPETKIITIEDPVEYQLPGISQTQIHKERGYDFASGLRSIVRQDPDVILVGEIRDEETADIATHASLTGHLVFSTVHANSASEAIPRLIDLGIRPSLISPAINAIIAQRLVRKLCPYCKEEYVPAPETLETINEFLSVISPKANVEIPKNIKTLYRAKGCPKCHNLGYKGRIGIFEILEIDKEMETLIQKVAPASELTASAIESGMITMLQDGILKAVTGETSMEEVQRVTGTGEFLKEIHERILKQLLSLQLKIKTDQVKALQKVGYNTKALEETIAKSSSKETLAYIVGGGLNFDAGDIHLEPEKDSVKIRYRIDGILQDIGTMDTNDYLPVLSQIKTLSGFKASSHEAVRDSRFGIKLEESFPNIKNTELDVRVSIIVGGYGETVVLRLLYKSAKSLDMKKIGLREQTTNHLLTEIEKPNGIILNTGPTGSGKTTTLYSLLNLLNKPQVKIITVEDPIEYRMAGILQTQVNIEEGYDFSTALRALLRQNPDILMIGEIRDEETARIAIQASLTGHLVLSTLHTNNAVASIQRLINMNIDPSDIASATNALMAQRLVRKLCPHCKKAVKLAGKTKDGVMETLKTISKKSGLTPPEKVDKIFVPVGCEKCKNTGYSGVVPVSEIMTISEELEELISRFSTTSAISKQAIEEGMITMAQDGIMKVVEGITSLDEVKRVTEE
ncbi:MAG: GspE/PulE family protein [Patescibacteria group bacterium]|nr:GspE/PulE family protein [Patescibacteria group bacterium]